MFNIFDPRYEQLGLDATTLYLSELCLTRALSLGAAPPPVAPHYSNPSLSIKPEKHALSKTDTYILTYCREVLETQRAALRQLNATRSSHDAMFEQRRNISRRIAEQFMHDELPPSAKIARLDDVIFRCVSDIAVDVARIDWESLVSFLSIRLALCRLEYGDWSDLVAHTELDLATCYVMLHRFDIAADHCKDCRAVIQHITNTAVSTNTVSSTAAQNHVRDDIVSAISAKCDFMDAISKCFRHSSSSSAVKPISRALQWSRAHCSDHSTDASAQSAFLFPYDFVHLCCLSVQYKDDRLHHQSLSDALSVALAHCNKFPDRVFWSYTASIYLHLDLLVVSDQNLRDMAVHSAKQKLVDDCQKAGSKKDLEDIRLKLETTLLALSEKSNALQLGIIRQVDTIHSRCSKLFEALNEMAQQQQHASTSPLLASSALNGHLKHAALMRFTWFRCLALGLRVEECATLLRPAHVFSACHGLDAFFGPLHPIVTCAYLDAASAMAGSDLPRCTWISASVLREVLSAQPNAAQLSEIASTNIYGTNQTSNSLVSLCDEDGSRGGGDDDDDDSLRASRLRTSTAFYERGLQQLLLLEPNHPLALPVIVATLRQLTVLLHRVHDTRKEVKYLAMLAALTGEMYGPTHTATTTGLRLVDAKRSRVHAPLFSPSWGVHAVLTNVTVSCDTPGAEIYFYIADNARGAGDEQSATVGTAVRYSAPIQLDKVGRMTVKAFSVKDGVQSGVVEARFSVVHSTKALF